MHFCKLKESRIIKTYAMIKKTIFTLMLLAVVGWVSAQSLQFEWAGHVYSEGETIECTNDEYGYGDFIQHMQLRNLTSGDLNVIIEKEEIDTIPGTSNYFCWGSCYGSAVYVSPNPVTIVAGSLNTDELSFHTFFDENVFGKVEMRYYAYDELNPSERVSINVVFHKSGEGVHNPVATHFGGAYPNPASSVVNFDYNLNPSDKATVSIYNLLGQEVKSISVNPLQERLTISVADLNEGIYFYNLFVNGSTMKTEKFVVKK